MKVKEVTSAIESIAPLSYQESYDNAGLIIGNFENEVKGILLCLDVTEEIVNEAIAKKCNLIIAHHPLIFKGLKKINGNNFVEKVTIAAIKNDINIYAAHTNLDNVLENGVNTKIAEKLGLKKTSILQPLNNNLSKLITYCPPAYAEDLKEALWEAGSGNIGNYDKCSFSMEGTGTFRPGETTNPFLGQKGELEKTEELRIEILFEKHNKHKLISALNQNHPYEEVAYEILDISNSDQTKGAGMIGFLEEPLSQEEFLKYLKEKMNLKVIKFTQSNKTQISKIAVCGGSGKFLLDLAIKQDADAFVSSDFKYHDYFEAEKKLMVCDIGHYESEIYTLEIFMRILKENFPTFATRLTEISTNPVNYYY